MRYAHGSIATRMYVAGKLRSDPVGSASSWRSATTHRSARSSISGGRGQLALLLLEAGVATEVHGLDWDAAKVEEMRAAEGLRATFAPGDVRTFDAEPADTVLLIDVLHYFTESEQSEILARAAGAAQKRLVVRDIDPERGLRSALTRLQERLTTRAKYNIGERVRVRSMREVRRELEALGFTVTIEPCWGKTPFSNVLVVAARSTA
ncbi:MAG: class I SAM-dependent methyltransferase [Polyangiaceae bacterium]